MPSKYPTPAVGMQAAPLAAFTGHTPSAYLALRRRFPAEPGFPPDMGPMPAR